MSTLTYIYNIYPVLLIESLIVEPPVSSPHSPANSDIPPGPSPASLWTRTTPWG